MVDGKPISWLGSSLDDLRAFEPEARRQAGTELRAVQRGEMPTDFKPMPSVGQGVYEIRVRTGRAYRVMYVVKFEEAIYVLHAFEKRTRKTRPADIDLARRRLAELIRRRADRKERQ